MMQRTVDYIMDKLYEKGANHIFFLPGGGYGCLGDVSV